MSKTPSKKRAIENADDDLMEEDDVSVGEDMEGSVDAEGEVAAEEDVGIDVDVDLLSPTPEKKKDMFLRSGKRKRRRSKETTGLTPPETIKKAKRERRRKAAEGEAPTEKEEATDQANQEDAEMEEPSAEGQTPNEKAKATLEQTNGNMTPRESVDQSSNGEAIATPADALSQPSSGGSAKSTDAKAVANAQDPELEITGSPESLSDANRRLFDGKPPPMSEQKSVAGAATPIASPTNQSNQRSPRKLSQAVSPMSPSPLKTSHGEENGVAEPPATRSIPCRIFFMVVLSLFFFNIWPLCVDFSETIIPLNDLPSLDDIQGQSEVDLEPEIIEEEAEVQIVEEIEIVTTEVEEDGVVAEINASIFNGLESMENFKTVSNNLEGSIDHIHKELSTIVDMIEKKLAMKKRKLEPQLKVLSEVETALNNALARSDLNSREWFEARQSTSLLGKNLLNTPAITLWEVKEPATCAELAVEEAEVEDSNPFLSPSVLNEELENLKANANSSAAQVMNSENSERAVREWVRNQIQKSLNGNQEASNAIAKLTSASEKEGISSMEDLDEVILERLEIERADRSGVFDHASMMNGAKVIHGGKRGTSKSLVDYLPIYNRLMQISQLRFYGYGPEAAITPTYPSDALGQCWSFKQPTVKEQLARSRLGGGSKEQGNFGTLTISLPSPIEVSSVVIEHPPQGLTGQVNTAIRAFRVIGYEDPLASGKSWSLGSFVFQIDNMRTLQEFEVATDIYGTPVPPMQSITLAVDSNWGFEYACLYRFRVHGEEDDEEDDD